MYALRRAVYLFAFVTTVAHAHEFWIEPSYFKVAPGERIVADLRVGRYFKGDSQVLFPAKFVSFDIIDAAGSRPVSGRLGDIPAATVTTQRAGLHVLAYRSTHSSVIYEDFAKLENFARAEGVEWVIDEHRRRGLPETGIKEAYTRYAKTLVQVGDGAGEDRPLGLPLELVAETNPYTSQPGDDIDVHLLWRNESDAGTQIAIFRKFKGCGATRTAVRTDSEGRAAIPWGTGGRVLLNAVHVIEPGAETLEHVPGAVWESFWASLAFGLPENRNEGEPCDPTDTSYEEVR
jgi:hypothetical protein